MDMHAQIEQARAAIAGRFAQRPTVGVVLGSGLQAFAQRVTHGVTLPYREIPHFPASSVPGHAGELVLGTLGDRTVAVMSGRVHYYEGYDMTQVVFPVRVLAALGVKQLVVTNAAGSVNPVFEAGDVMIIADHLNLTGANPLRGPNHDALGPRFPDMSHAYDPEGRRIMGQAALAVKAPLQEGVYAGLAGPCYETPAEIRMLRTLGADAVGMSTVAEVIAARHCGMRVVGLSLITNKGAGLSQSALSHAEVKEMGDRMKGPLCEVLERTVQAWQ